MKNFSTISSLLLVGTTVGMLLSKWALLTKNQVELSEEGFPLYL